MVDKRVTTLQQIMVMYVGFGLPHFNHISLVALVINTSKETPTFEVFVPFSTSDYYSIVKNTMCKIITLMKHEFDRVLPLENKLNRMATEECDNSPNSARSGIYKITINHDRNRVHLNFIVQCNVLVFWFVCHRLLVLRVKGKIEPWVYQNMNRMFERDEASNRLASQAMVFYDAFYQRTKQSIVGINKNMTLDLSPEHVNDKNMAQLMNAIPKLSQADLFNLPWTYPQYIQNTVWFPPEPEDIQIPSMEDIDRMDVTEDESKKTTFHLPDIIAMENFTSSIKLSEKNTIQANLPNSSEDKPMTFRFGINQGSMRQNLGAMKFNLVR